MSLIDYTDKTLYLQKCTTLWSGHISGYFFWNCTTMLCSWAGTHYRVSLWRPTFFLIPRQRSSSCLHFRLVSFVQLSQFSSKYFTIHSFWNEFVNSLLHNCNILPLFFSSLHHNFNIFPQFYYFPSSSSSSSFLLFFLHHHRHISIVFPPPPPPAPHFYCFSSTTTTTTATTFLLFSLHHHHHRHISIVFPPLAPPPPSPHFYLLIINWLTVHENDKTFISSR